MGDDESKLTRTKRQWADQGKFLTGRIARPETDRLPPGQHLGKMHKKSKARDIRAGMRPISAHDFRGIFIERAHLLIQLVEQLLLY